jgi:hypothetical protein
LEKVPLYKYIGIDIHHKLNWNYNIEKVIIGGWKAYCGLENNCKLAELWLWDKRYYKEVVNPNLEDQKYLYVLTSLKKRINIAKIRTNSHELHSETGDIGQSPKHHGMKEYVTFVTPRGLKMKNTFS